MITAKRERARARQRRRRQRLRAGCRMARIEISEALIEDALLAGGFLTPAQADDPAKVDAALASAVEAWAEEQLAASLVEDVTRDNPPFEFAP